MVQVVPGRFTAKMDEPFVVFVIGMRINRPLAVRKWLPTVRAMGPMLKELYKHPEKGFLGAEFFIYRWGSAILQYWRSFEELERFARNPDDPHLPAWQRFNRTVGKDGSVGIFHATFIVERGTHEAARAPMPRFSRTRRNDASVGIFHETFIVERGNYEAVYSNMPVFGLAKATEHVRAVGGRETARRRLMRGENEPAVPSPE